MSVRVRFAPSPTGYLHIGGLRTALYNYLFARHNKGSLILRIEDTDRTRLVENASENLIRTLSWAGIICDEGPGIGGDYKPYVQSERLEIYKKYANLLLENGSAYYAFDTPSEIEESRNANQKAGKDTKYDSSKMHNQFTLGKDETEKLIENGIPHVIRLKVPPLDIHFKDIIRGDVIVNGRDIDDQVLLKSDGFPTYHLANVVDDHLMKITHVIRGEEWLPSTPKHIILYHAFGWDIPEFAHLPLLLNKDKSKLSKRQGSVAVEDFINEGYFKEALINFVALLGWNPTSDREFYSLEELIGNFDLEKVNKGGAVFDKTKLEWMNFQYLKTKDLSDLAEQLHFVLKSKGIIDFPVEYVARVIGLLRERVKFLHEIPDFGNYMFVPPKHFDLEYFKKCWKDDTEELIISYLETLKQNDDFSHNKLNELTLKYIEEKEKRLKEIIHPLRLMITGVPAGAGMFETMEVLGKEECIKRIEYFLKEQDKIKI